MSDVEEGLPEWRAARMPIKRGSPRAQCAGALLRASSKRACTSSSLTPRPSSYRGRALPTYMKVIGFGPPI
jgi:hypothetical protein